MDDMMDIARELEAEYRGNDYGDDEEEDMHLVKDTIIEANERASALRQETAPDFPTLAAFQLRDWIEKQLANEDLNLRFERDLIRLNEELAYMAGRFG